MNLPNFELGKRNILLVIAIVFLGIITITTVFFITQPEFRALLFPKAAVPTITWLGKGPGDYNVNQGEFLFWKHGGTVDIMPGPTSKTLTEGQRAWKCVGECEGKFLDWDVAFDFGKTVVQGNKIIYVGIDDDCEDNTSCSPWCETDHGALYGDNISCKDRGYGVRRNRFFIGYTKQQVEAMTPVQRKNNATFSIPEGMVFSGEFEVPQGKSGNVVLYAEDSIFAYIDVQAAPITPTPTPTSTPTITPTPTATSTPGPNLGSIGDCVWKDLDEDGVKDTGELGIAGVEVKLIEAGPDGILGNTDDVNKGTKTTTANCFYKFTDLPAGKYRASVAESQAELTEMTRTTDDNPIDVVPLAAGQDYLDADFGYNQAAEPTNTPTPTPTPTGTQTPTPTITPTPTPLLGCDKTCSSDNDCDGDYVCWEISSGNKRCRNTSCHDESDCACNRSCWQVCGTNSECPSDLSCQQIGQYKRCVNPDCSSDSDCNCLNPTPTPTTAGTGVRVSTPTPVIELPRAGMSLPLVISTVGGIILLLVGLIL